MEEQGSVLEEEEEDLDMQADLCAAVEELEDREIPPPPSQRCSYSLQILFGRSWWCS